MAAWATAIASIIGAGASSYNAISNSMKGAPPPGGVQGGGNKKQFELPDMFGGKSNGMLGGEGQRPVASLAGSLQGNPASQNFGPTPGSQNTFLDDEQRRQWLARLMG